MAMLLEAPIVKPSVPVLKSIQPVTEIPLTKPEAVESPRKEGSALDGLLIWICINCGLLLFGMHVYEVLFWIRR